MHLLRLASEHSVFLFFSFLDFGASVLIYFVFTPFSGGFYYHLLVVFIKRKLGNASLCLFVHCLTFWIRNWFGLPIRCWVSPFEGCPRTSLCCPVLCQILLVGFENLISLYFPIRTWWQMLLLVGGTTLFTEGLDNFVPKKEMNVLYI